MALIPPIGWILREFFDEILGRKTWKMGRIFQKAGLENGECGWRQQEVEGEKGRGGGVRLYYFILIITIFIFYFLF